MRQHNWYGRLGVALTVLMVGFAGVGMFWTPYEPTAMVGADKYAPPSLAHPFGCDQLGRDILSRMGVTEIESLGQKFDPALHNAVMHEEDETKGEGEIVQELQRGFKMGDKVIRFAMVKVAN